MNRKKDHPRLRIRYQSELIAVTIGRTPGGVKKTMQRLELGRRTEDFAFFLRLWRQSAGLAPQMIADRISKATKKKIASSRKQPVPVSVLPAGIVRRKKKKAHKIKFTAKEIAKTFLRSYPIISLKSSANDVLDAAS